MSMYSCREEVLQTSIEDTKVQISDASVKNGRLFFPNKESLQSTYTILKKEKPSKIIEFMENLGVESLVPIVSNSNEEMVLSLLKQRKVKLAKSNKKTVKITDDEIISDLDDLEEVIGDDTYTAMLNENAEVQIGNDIYKYTDVGLFIVNENSYSVLEKYLAVKSISDNLLFPTSLDIKNQIVNEFPSGVITSISTSKISRIAAEILYFNSIQPNEDENGNGGSFTNDVYNPKTSELSIDQIIDNIKIGEVRKPWIGNVFGNTWETDDQYESRRRVKVKFYSQNLWLLYVVGCKVKHQYKGWTGLWRKENADKLGIGVNSIGWTFSHSFNMNITKTGVPL